MNLILWVILCLVIFEVGLCLLVNWLRRDFQWLITSRDHSPVLDKKGLYRFFYHGADPVLGWVRKPLSIGKEKGKSGESIQYRINKWGARRNFEYDDKPGVVMVVGDSYAFCRQVRDDQTWTYLASRALGVNILNFGVGNYGLDQAVLRMKRELPKLSFKVVIFGVVPETICRVQGVWKHYCEYGNTFAFKPRFSLSKDGALILHPNRVNTFEKYVNYKQFESELQRLDRFYKKKFLPDMLRFPYCLSLLRSVERNIPLIAALIHAKCSSDVNVKKKPFRMVLDRNHAISSRLYSEDASLNLMEAIVNDGAKFVREHGAEPIFVMLPQLQDIKSMRTQGVFYENFLNRIRSSVPVVDIGAVLLRTPHIEEYYTDDMYGGHLSVKGNELASKTICKIIDNLLPKGNI